MDGSYFDMLRGNKIQVQYFRGVLERRNAFCDQAFLVPITEYFPHGSEVSTCLELAYHGMTPLYKFGVLLVDEQARWDDLDIITLKGTPTQQFLRVYSTVIEQVEDALEQADIRTLGGEFEQFRKDEETLKHRFGIFTMHAMQHMGQVIKLQGLISEELAKQEKKS